jgi:hypothetical protein
MAVESDESDSNCSGTFEVGQDSTARGTRKRSKNKQATKKEKKRALRYEYFFHTGLLVLIFKTKKIM